MNKITVFTIVYNNYGHFIPQWLNFINNQTIPVDKFVVLGENHGADLEYLDKNNIKYILCDSKNMGKLRNAGLEEIKTEWWQYFAVDDELLPHACEEIVNTDADAVSLRFNAIHIDNKVLKNCYSPKITSIKELNEWKKNWGGYLAVKGNTDLRFREDIEVPNLSFHMEMFRRGLKVVHSDTICVVHHRWAESHHFRSYKDGTRRESVKLIEEQAKEILIEYVMKNAKSVKIKAKQEYKDIELNKIILENQVYPTSVERGILIVSNDLATFDSIIPRSI